eukprot:158885-Ditylum_brightwellii.AAC.1
MDADQSTCWLIKAHLRESVYHIVCNCTPLASTKYLAQHNEVAKYLHWHMLCNRKIPVCKQWWQHKPLTAMLIDNLKLTWDYTWDTEGKKIENNSDIVVIDKLAKTGQLIDVAVLYDTNIVSTAADKTTKY